MNLTMVDVSYHSIGLDTKLRKIERELCRLYEFLDQKPANQLYLSQVSNSLEELKSIVESPSDNKEFHQIGDDKFQVLIQSLQQLSIKGFCLLEKELTSKNTFEKYHDDVELKVFSHATKAGINDQSRVLVVGCGGFPLSCFVLSKKFNCEVVGIDCDESAINSANKLKDQLQLGNTQFLTDKGELCSASEFSHILVASLVPNKKEILDHLYKQINFEQLVLCRYGEGLQQVINYSLGEVDNDQWDKQWIENKPGSMYQTLALKKKVY